MAERASKPVVLFRTDANGTVGAGHLMRCLALADAFRRSGRRPIFVTRETSPEMSAVIRRRRFGQVVLPPRLSVGTEGALMAALAVARDAQGVVVDRYALPTTYLSSLRRLRPDWTVLQFDDLGTPLRGTDLILNQNFYATRSFYRKISRATKLLLGPRHAVLRPEFLARKPAGVVRSDVRRIVVTTGGGNQADALARLTASVLEEAPRARVVAVSGFQKGVARSRFSSDPRVTVKASVNNMATLLGGADLAVSAAGTTLYELCYLGVPAVCVVVAHNQIQNARSADRDGVAISLGNLASVSEKNIRQAIRRLVSSSEERARMRRRQRKLVDGRGADRVVAAFNRMSR